MSIHFLTKNSILVSPLMATIKFQPVTKFQVSSKMYLLSELVQPWLKNAAFFFLTLTMAYLLACQSSVWLQSKHFSTNIDSQKEEMYLLALLFKN